MLKKSKQEIAEVIDGMGELETTIAQHSHYDGAATKAVQVEWVNKLSKLTSKLDKVWKAEGNTP